MTSDSEGLHEIANTWSPERQADIVFVHGLGGVSHGTWRHRTEDKVGHFFWPEELGKNLPHCGIWTVGYPAGFTALGKPGMIIEKRAGNMSLKLANAGLGVRPLLFITHSMGGLIVKSLIVGSQTLADADRKRIVSVIRGIVFCATPHRGSAFADAAGVLSKFFGGSQHHVDEMRANAEPLDILHDQFIEWHRSHPIAVDSYAENIGLFRTRWWRRPLPLGLVVPRASANPGIAGYTVHDVDDDHLTIVKPPNSKHDVYAGVLRFVPAALAPMPRSKRFPTDAALIEKDHAIAETTPANAPEISADISRIVRYSPVELIGRDDELKLLNDTWDKAVRGEKKRPHILTIVALGGEGKTSLVAKWAADLAHQGWPGCEAVFAWSFYSQGTREQTAASSDVFLKEALAVFGDPAMADGAQTAFDKGRRLAQLVSERRTLLILDGLEPLQYAPTSPTPGELKDQGLAALLKGLAAKNHGLCVVTTRYSIPDLRAYWQSTAPETKLPRLSKEAGVALLRSLGVTATSQEFETLVEDVKGHALTLNLLGAWLHAVHAGDIRKRAFVKLEEADAEEQGGHAFRVMDAYARWFDGEGDKGKRAIAMLRLLGLFDRPVTADCLTALLKAPAIPDLTEALVGMSEVQRNMAFTRLEAAMLLTVNRDSARTLVSLDAHPLLREYFARQLRTQHPDAWRAAHQRLYEHLCANTQDKPQPTLEDLQPLYQAVAHGCQAKMQKEALDKVYIARILRGEEYYSIRKLGAFGSELGAISCFFELPWSRVSGSVTEADQALLLSQAAISLRAVGRLTEAIEPMRAGLVNYLAQEHWEYAARCAGNLSELELTLGEVADAVADAEQSVVYADRNGDAYEPLKGRTKLADALHQAGRRAEAKTRFHEAESLQSKNQTASALLCSVPGFRYCDLFLAEAERGAWQTLLGLKIENWNPETLTAVSERAAQTLKWAEQHLGLLDNALDHLTLGRAALYRAVLTSEFSLKIEYRNLETAITAAVNGLRSAGQQQYLPPSLLTRAWLRSLIGPRAGPESAQCDLDEAWEIAERGPMKLFLADIHLHRARLFGMQKEENGIQKYPWKSSREDLAAAEKLINDCGYHRRDQELADATSAMVHGTSFLPADPAKEPNF